MDKIKSLESLRGLAAFTVVLEHFFASFYPWLFDRKSQVHSQYEETFLNSFLTFIINGQFAVVLFFVLSGFVLSYGYYTRGFDLISATAKRYFRLMPIVLVSILIAYLLLKLGFFYNQEAGKVSGSEFLSTFWLNKDVNMLTALWDGFVGTFSTQPTRASLNPVLWTIYYELIGSILVFAVISLVKTDRRRIYIYGLLLVALISTWYVGFILGLILADIYCHKNEIFLYIQKVRSFYRIGLLGIVIYIASYLSVDSVVLQPGFFSPLTFFPNTSLNMTVLYLIAAGIMITLLITSRRVKGFFEIQWLVRLGSLSYSLYASHMIVLGSAVSGLFVIFSNHLSYNLATLCAFLVYIILAIVAAIILRVYVDIPSVKSSKGIVDGIFKDKKPALNQVEENL